MNNEIKFACLMTSQKRQEKRNKRNKRYKRRAVGQAGSSESVPHHGCATALLGGKEGSGGVRQNESWHDRMEGGAGEIGESYNVE